MLSIGGRVNIRRQVRWRQSLNFFLHALLHSLEHGAAAGEDDIFEQVPPDVLLALDDCLVSVLMDSILTLIHLLTPQTWVEENLGTLEALLVHSDRLGARQFVLLRRHGAISGSFEFCIEVMCDLAVLMLDFKSNVERFLSLLLSVDGDVLGVLSVEQLDHVVG